MHLLPLDLMLPSGRNDTFRRICILQPPKDPVTQAMGVAGDQQDVGARGCHAFSPPPTFQRGGPISPHDSVFISWFSASSYPCLKTLLFLFRNLFPNVSPVPENRRQL